MICFFLYPACGELWAFLLCVLCVQVFEGYVDDTRNTDNAWVEITVLNLHLNRTGQLMEHVSNTVRTCLFPALDMCKYRLMIEMQKLAFVWYFEGKSACDAPFRWRAATALSSGTRSAAGPGSPRATETLCSVSPSCTTGSSNAPSSWPDSAALKALVEKKNT